jgi:acetyl-CoA acetyltransferase
MGQRQDQRGRDRAAAAIVGVADAVSPTGELDGSLRAVEARVIREALDDAGLSLCEVDAVFSCTGGSFMPSVELAEYLGITPSWTDATQTGGSSFEIMVEHAAAAIAAGHVDVALVTYAALPRSSFKKGGAGFGGGAHRAAMAGILSPMVEWELPYGMRAPMGAYALAASRHMAVYGTTSEQLAEIAVSTRQWASRNRRARLQEPITVADVLASPLEASPLRKLDCCLVTDGAGAVVLTSAARAADLRRPTVVVLGTGTGHTHSMISQMPDLTVTAGAVSGPRALSMAGVTPEDIDVVELYDSFTITVLLALEDLGFCGKGEGGSFVEGGRLGPGGALPANTNGGGLAYTHPGMYGIFLLVEAVRQLRGEGGPRQVPGAEVALVHGCGGVLSSTSTVVLGTEATR